MFFLEREIYIRWRKFHLCVLLGNYKYNHDIFLQTQHRHPTPGPYLHVMYHYVANAPRLRVVQYMLLRILLINRFWCANSTAKNTFCVLHKRRTYWNTRICETLYCLTSATDVNVSSCVWTFHTLDSTSIISPKWAVLWADNNDWYVKSVCKKGMCPCNRVVDESGEIVHHNTEFKVSKKLTTFAKFWSSLLSVRVIITCVAYPHSSDLILQAL